MDAKSIQKTLKIVNFTSNALLMRIITDIYLKKAFHLEKSLGVRGHKQKNSQSESKYFLAQF